MVYMCVSVIPQRICYICAWMCGCVCENTHFLYNKNLNGESRLLDLCFSIIDIEPEHNSLTFESKRRSYTLIQEDAKLTIVNLKKLSS